MKTSINSTSSVCDTLRHPALKQYTPCCSVESSHPEHQPIRRNPHATGLTEKEDPSQGKNSTNPHQLFPKEHGQEGAIEAQKFELLEA